MTRQARLGKLRTSKTMDKLSYSPNKHKNEKSKKMRAELQAKNKSLENNPSSKASLKFGSFNVNGLDLDSGWAIQQILTNRGFDVSLLYLKLCSFNYKLTRFLHSLKLLAEQTSPHGSTLCLATRCGIRREVEQIKVEEVSLCSTGRA